MHDPRVPAPRPALAPLKSHSAVFPQSPAALHGATSAFLPKSPNSAVNESSVSAGARLAAFTAGSHAQQRSLPASRSPPSEQSRNPAPYGRDIPLHAALLTGSIGPSASSSAHTRFSRPLLPLRSSSTLAAQRASANSTSPQRTPSKSPKNNIIPVSSPRRNEQQNYGTNAVPETMAPAAAKQQQESAQAGSSEPVKERILAFEKLPSLSGPNPSSVLTKDIKSRPSFQGNQLPQLDGVQGRPVPLDRADSREDIPSSAITTLTPPSGLSRQSSEVSATASEHAVVKPMWRATELPKSEYLPIPIGRPGRPQFQAKSPQNHSFRTQDEHRNAMKISALADAMVASSLASSRAASPSKRSPPPAPRRRSRSVTALYDLDFMNEHGDKEKPKRKTRTMKHTLRKQVSSDDEGIELAKRGRRHWVRKHPNMHSEGNRKRWRDKVTELERKRYEGVFAANRGYLIGSGYFEPSVEMLTDNTAPENRVLNVVVRDIWERSRLPREVLREVYDLVSPVEELALSREQFVVGLWLIDQRLKGRKLPIKVSPSVWDSVRHSQGIKIRRRLL